MSRNRREFLQAGLASALVLSLDGMAPRVLVHAAEESSALQPDSAADNILVIVQLTGGNDGLNTVVPFTNDVYYRSRPKLAIPAGNVLRINDQFGLHPSMAGMHELYQSGRLAIVQGVGYPEPNRSHFESMDIWHSCARKEQRSTAGWIGRYLDELPPANDTPSLHLGDEKQPLALMGQRVRTPSIGSLDRFRLRGEDSGKTAEAVRELAATSPQAGDNDLLGFVQTSTTAAVTLSQRMEHAAKDYQTPIEYPNTGLAKKLRTVAQLLDAGLKTRVYYVALDGFDTHSQQAAAHTALVTEFSAAVKAFMDDLAHHRQLDRVTLFAFSEFGRRVEENASEGTDHGAAAPIFLAGGRVHGGIHGEHPSLMDLDDGDLKHHTDFRRVYATLLERWLKWPSDKVLGGQYAPLDLVKSA